MSEVISFNQIQESLLKDRNIFLNFSIDASTSCAVSQMLLYLDGEDKQAPINLYISGPGGDVYSGFGLIDVIRSINAPVYTFCSGLCASMSALIFLNGDKRYVMPNSTLMLHQPLGGASGQASDIELVAKEILRIKASINDMIAKYCHLDKRRIEKLTDRDCYIDAKTALGYGLADEIITNKKDK